MQCSCRPSRPVFYSRIWNTFCIQLCGFVTSPPCIWSQMWPKYTIFIYAQESGEYSPSTGGQTPVPGIRGLLQPSNWCVKLVCYCSTTRIATQSICTWNPGNHVKPLFLKSSSDFGGRVGWNSDQWFSSHNITFKDRHAKCTLYYRITKNNMLYDHCPINNTREVNSSIFHSMPRNPGKIMFLQNTEGQHAANEGLNASS